MRTATRPRRWTAQWMMGLATAAALLAGCQRQPITGPPTIQYGQDVCSRCGMIISDARFAAAAIVQGSDQELQYRLFDDLGCLIVDERDHPERRMAVRYVMAADTEQWVNAAAAVYVPSDPARSPMAYNILAYADPARARAAAQASGHPSTLDLPDVASLLAGRVPDRRSSHAY
ncbi:MAG TPA: nitrous oxide reductase accessory protein NosL [Phycisphaeraceae bacterium]